MATETLRPDAAGDETSITYQYPDSTYHWDKVDEAVADDSDTSVYEELAVYARDLYNLPASSGSGTINFIKVYFGCRGWHADCRAKPSLKSNSTVTDGTEITPSIGSYTTYSQQWNTNPADAGAWEWADIDALQIGVYLLGATGGYASACTQVYVEIDYEPTIVRTAEISIGTAMTASRAITIGRTASITQGISMAASRGFSKIASIATGIAVSATKSYGWAKSASITIGNAITATRLGATSRSSAITTGIAMSASKVLGRFRTSAITIGTAVTVTRLRTIARTSALTFGTVMSASWAVVEVPRIRLTALTLRVRSLALNLIKRGSQ